MLATDFITLLEVYVVMLLFYVMLSKYYLNIHITFGFIQSLNMCSAYLGQWIDGNE